MLTAFFLAYLFSLILQLFSYIYWTYGTTKNFSVNLTHFDSFYFALGTLTTVGSGTIRGRPARQHARSRQCRSA